MVVIEEHVHPLWVASKDPCFDFLEFSVVVVMRVPTGPPMDTLVHDLVVHDFCWEMWCVDAHEQYLMVVTPRFDLIGKQ